MYSRFGKLITWLPVLCAFLLPALVTVPHIGTFFVGPDFSFPFQEVQQSYDFYAWNDRYVGEKAQPSSNLFAYALATGVVALVGEKHAPVLFVYLALVLYLLSALLLAQYVRKRSSGNDFMFFRITQDCLLVLVAFFSPVVLGYLTNYFTIPILLSSVFVSLSLYAIFRFLDDGSFYFLAFATLCTLGIAHPPTLFFYVGLAVIFLSFTKGWYSCATFTFSVFGLHAFWMIIFAINILSVETTSLSANAEYIEHMLGWYGSNAGVLPSAIFSIYPYTSSRLFAVVPLSLFSLLYALLWVVAFLSLFWSKCRSDRVVYGLYIVLSIGLFFSLGPHGPAGIFTFLFTYIPGMSLFKSFTQVLNVVFIFFLVIFTISMTKLHEKKHIFILLLTLTMGGIFAIARFIPSINSYIIRGDIPHEYEVARDIVNEDPTEGRILELPEIAYPYFSWLGIWDSLTFEQRWFSKPVVYFGTVVPGTAAAIKPLDSDYTQMFIENNFRYLLVRKDHGKQKFNPSPFVFDYSVVETVMSNAYFDFYRIKDQFFTPKMYAIGGDAQVKAFRKINPVRYQVQLSGLDSEAVLVFLEAYDSSWNIVPVKTSGDCLDANGIPNVFQAFMRAPLADSTHRVFNQYANSWTINVDDIVRGYSSEMYTKNADGSIDVCLTVYFKSQAYLYPVGTVSFVTFIFLGWLVLRKEEKQDE